MRTESLVVIVEMDLNAVHTELCLLLACFLPQAASSLLTPKRVASFIGDSQFDGDTFEMA